MRKAAWLLLSLLLVPSWVSANQPPPQKTFEERLELATHVIVGTAKNVRVIEGVPDGNGHVDLKEVKPEPTNINGFNQYVEVEIEVNEALYPSKWQPPKTVRYLFGGGIFAVQSVRQDTVGKKRIYLMRGDQYGELNNAENVFFPSYDWHLAELLDSKTGIVELLQKRVEREEKAAATKN